MKLYRCPKCDKYANEHTLCSGCGQAWTKSYTISETKLKERHEMSYYMMEKEQGKKMADKQWKKAH